MNNFPFTNSDDKDFADQYMRLMNQELYRSFAIPASMFYVSPPVKFSDTVGQYPQKEKNMKYVVEKFSSNAWKEVRVENTQGQAMNWSNDIKWSTGPEGMKFGIDSWSYLYRIVEKKAQWAVFSRSKNSSEWFRLGEADSVTAGTKQLGSQIAWNPINDSNECFGIGRDGTAYKVVRNE